MSRVELVAFPDFANATGFCRWIGCGVVCPSQGRAGYVWHSEGTTLDETQRCRYDAYLGIDSVWHDDESGLTWLYSSAYFSLFPICFDAGPAPFFAGFADWRSPTLTELKTLRSDMQDKNGLWRTTELAGKIGAVLRSVTNGYFDRDERRDWDFARDCACEDDYRDSKIAWGSEGQYAGFEGGRSRRTGAEYIRVRGTYSARLPEWLQAQVKWAEQHRRFDDFPVTEKTIGRLTDLRVRDDNFPPHLDRLAGLRHLHVQNSATLEPSVFALPALETLTWDVKLHVPAARQAVRLPPGVRDLTHLRKLSVRGPIEVVPDAICDLGSLEELDLGCAVAALPAALGRLSKLRALRVSSKRMNSLPSSIGQLSALAELCVHAEDLRRLPEEVALLQSLVRLDMSRCSIQQLPARLGELRSLKELSLEFNQLSEVPAVVSELHQLEKLDLSFNPLTALPLEVGALKSLKSLDLCGVPIVEVPVAVRELPNLETLDLSGTQIRELPQWIWEMKSLRRLVIASTWKLLRKPKQDHPTIKVINSYVHALDQPWGREWLQKMGKPD